MDQLADLRGHIHQLVNAEPTKESRVVTLLAPSALPERSAALQRQPRIKHCLLAGVVLRRAVRTDPPEKTLRDRPDNGAREQIGLDAHIKESRNGAGRIVRR